MNNRVYYNHQTHNSFRNLLTIDKKYYKRIHSIYNLIVSKESIDILLLCYNIIHLTILLPDAHPEVQDAKYYNDTVTALVPPIILIRYKLDIVLVDKNNRELYVWNNDNINSYYIHNNIIKVYYYVPENISYKYNCYKIVSSAIECKPINNLYKMIIKLVLDNSTYSWLNLNYSLKNLVTPMTHHNSKTPYKCKVKLCKPRDP